MQRPQDTIRILKMKFNSETASLERGAPSNGLTQRHVPWSMSIIAGFRSINGGCL
jgi:hypothetical protein